MKSYFSCMYKTGRCGSLPDMLKRCELCRVTVLRKKGFNKLEMQYLNDVLLHLQIVYLLLALPLHTFP